MKLIRSMLPVVVVAVALSHVVAGEPRTEDRQIAPEFYDFGKMSEAQAKRLDGNRVKVRLRIPTTAFFVNGDGAANACSGEGTECRRVFFSDETIIRQKQIDRDMFVEGRLELRPSQRLQSYDLPAFLLLKDAKIVKP
jgi:hypothetical protein